MTPHNKVKIKSEISLIVIRCLLKSRVKSQKERKLQGSEDVYALVAGEIANHHYLIS